MTNLFQLGVRAIGSLWRDEKGIGTLEIVLIAAVLIMVALFFKDWIMDFLGSLMDSVEGKANTIFK
ncbi:Flp1 family type IVb pilin [Cohnella silvisoli]|uniref:Flp1 family type IVb pilin n=1 Tax=Cohnella silvisoli TaxID=2873699 RepID=A0ABV1KYQ2_9BACL|nr:Flp1 family type IVb pilin [Cohnella silvisoli]MCD9024026.1 multidrug transporter [Cohnella silvisoli]